ncbi:hypothetical protein GCM10007907_30000 [Chitinimonas prasina]|uniref:MAPEG family protein n=1 Tax=Chitinimonas prasina TaxID=1434937 RepID=A0ABQ5YGS8_9NEIS|nr:MAPEG family protein [Chitinimonas prasina]GLR14210.1 hypothetical protein GCM10007907_30000 [Chitinimonas prasina]
MNPTAVALLGYAGWCVLMVLLLINHRALFLLRGERAVNGFTADNKGLGDLAERIVRVHGNCIENLPLVATVLLYAIATGQTAVTDAAAPLLLGLRVSQSLVHLSGTRAWQVWLRLGCFLGQLAILAMWLLQLLMKL